MSRPRIGAPLLLAHQPSGREGTRIRSIAGQPGLFEEILLMDEILGLNN